MTPAPEVAAAPVVASGRRVYRGGMAVHGPLLFVWLATALFLLLFVDRGWIRGDEGLLGQTAERVMAGELPHRDFDDMYTGGLAMVHAAAFRILGVHLTSIRWLLYAATLIFVPVVYRIALRFAAPWTAAAVTALCVVWSVPAYFAGLPSWYNLFLAGGTVLALLRWIETERPSWLFVAGVCAGTSFLFKSAALLLVAAVLLLFVFREQERALASTTDDPAARRFGFALFTSAGLAIFVGVLASFVGQAPNEMAITLFVMPGAALAGYLVARAWRHPHGAFTARLRRLLHPVPPFALGVVLPLSVFVGWYALHGSARVLLDARFLFETKRLVFTTFPLPPLRTIVCTLPFLALLLWPIVLGPRPRLERRLLAPAALLAVLVAAFGLEPMVYQSVWFSLRPMVPALVVGGILMLTRVGRQLESRQRQQVFLLLAAVAVISVLQFPYAWGLYFCYVAPLVILATTALVHATPAAPRRLHACLMVLYLGFGLLWVDFADAETHGWSFGWRPQDTHFDIERAGLRIGGDQAEAYNLLVAAVQERVPPDEPILALPDCPEIYYLTGRRNPTATLGDYFDDDFGTPARDQRLLDTIEREGINLVVLHWAANFSGKPPQALVKAVHRRFPHRLEIQPFSLHWRDRPADRHSVPGEPGDPGTTRIQSNEP